MDKSCDNCYYLIFGNSNLRRITNAFCHFNQDKPIKNVCEKYSMGCKHCKTNASYSEEVEFRHKNELYCAECLANVLGIEKREYIAYQYYDIHGNFLGDSETNDLQNILLDCSFVEQVGGE